MVGNQKNKNSGYGTLILGFLLLISVAWLVGTAYIAEQTEKHIRLVFDKRGNHSSFYVDLLDYERSLLSAHFSARLRSKDPSLDKAMSALVFRTDIKHGPLIFNQYNLQLATASLTSHLDQASMNADMQELLVRLFNKNEPLIGHVLVDYNLQKHFQIQLGALDYQVAEMVFKMSPGSATGIFQQGVEDIPIVFEFDEIVFKQDENSIQSLRNHFALDVYDIFNVNGDKQDNKNTRFESTVMRSTTADYVGLSVNLEHLQVGNLLNLLQRYEDRYNLDQQIEWTLELTGHHQEGQDRLIALYSEQEMAMFPEIDQLISQLFEENLSVISFLHKIEHQNASLAYNNSQEYLSE